MTGQTTDAPTVTETMQSLLEGAKTREAEALTDITAALKAYDDAETDLEDKLKKARVLRDGQLKHSRTNRDAARDDIRHLRKALGIRVTPGADAPERGRSRDGKDHGDPAERR